MEELEESSCPTSSPLIKIVPIKPGNTQKPSKFSILHRSSKHSDGRYIDQSSKNRLATCRICLEEAAQGSMIKPCKCTGTIQFLHERCMGQWIKTKIQKGQLSIRCELCQTLYNYEHSQRKRIACSQIQTNWQRKGAEMCCYFTFYLMGLLFLISFIVVLCIASNDNGNLKSKIIPNQTIMLIYVAAILLSFLFLLFITFLFLSEYCTKKQIVVSVSRYTTPKLKVIRKSRNSVIKV